MCNSQLPNPGLVDEIIPGGDVRERHEVVDVLDRVLGVERQSGLVNVWKLGGGMDGSRHLSTLCYPGNIQGRG